MSTLERRVALLLDQARYAELARESESTGRSVGSLIREAIDLRFHASGGSRAAAASHLLAITEAPDEDPGDDWATVKQSLEDDVAGRVG